MAKDISGKGLENHYFRKRSVRLCALILGAALAVLFSLALTLDFDPSTCLFKHESLLGSISFYAALLSSIVLAVLPFIAIPKETINETVFPEESKYTHYYTTDLPFIKLLRGFVAVLISAQGIVRIILFITGTEKAALPLITVAIMLISVFPLALYFVPEITEKAGIAEGRLHLMLGCIGLIWALLNILNSYFNKSYSLSSEYVTLQQLCLVSVMLATVYEVRYRLDGTKIRARLATTSLAFALCFGFNFGRIVMIVTSGAVSFTDVCMTFTLFAISLYYGARLFFYEED